jgi:hypothetical protein
LSRLSRSPLSRSFRSGAKVKDDKEHKDQSRAKRTLT